MPQVTDLNISPYFDDFNEDKNFHRILFRPSTAVQARELTQLQSILQNQIERFGNWAFKNGDIVSGCAIQDLPVVPFVRLADFQVNGAAYSASDLVNTQVVSAQSNLLARVIIANTGLTTNYPDTNIVYLQYLNTGNNSATTFANTDQLTFYKIPRTGNNTADTVAVVNAYVNSTANTFTVGNSHCISVSEGIVFLSGSFVKVQTPTFSVVNAYGVYAANSVVGFQATESIITENQDSSLNDNALGYDNENAPGAHRLKIIPSLISLDPVTAANTSGFNPIVSYNYGALVSKATVGSNVYSIVGDVLAQRTYEESGNYVVNPFVVDSVTEVAANSIVQALDANSVLGRVNPGVGYAQGKRVEILKTSYINMRRGTDTVVNKQQQITFNYGGYLLLNEVAGSFDFNKVETVQLYDTVQKTVTNRTFSSLTPSGNNIGTASLRCFAYNSGTPGTNTALYTLHIFNINLANGYNTGKIKSVYYNGTNKGVGDVVSTGTVSSTLKDQLYSFGITGIKTLRDGSNNNNSEYTYKTKSTVSMVANGQFTVTLPASVTGGIDILPYGVGQLTDSEAGTFNLSLNANAQSNALSGTVSVYSVNTYVLGSSSTFLSDYNIGQMIKVGSDIRTITSISNNTVLNVDSAFSSNASAQSYYNVYLKGQLVPIVYNVGYGHPGYVSVTNTTSFTVQSGLRPSGSVSCDMVYDVLRTQVIPAKKVINKNCYVKISTSNNSAGPAGPWCLGFSDVHKISKVYGSSNGTYTTAGVDITNQFVFGTGQRDTHYDLAYLYPKSSYSQSTNPYLLVQLDYFTTNTAAGLGFYTVESYPIDDANTANTSAITTSEIPLYIDEAGFKTPLRDYVDFRVPSTSTANNTGAVDTSNATQVTTAITYASVNPSATVSFNVPVTGLNIPSYGKNFQADYTAYLPRKDLVYITPDNVIKVKEGVPSTSPQTPLFPDNAMAVAVINVPPYPSLSSDQVDQLKALNNLSKNLVRDTSLSISSDIVTNRRYTMRDIGKLDKRITNLEYYTQLSLLEKKAADMTITDQNGLNRFKNGIFVDPFSDFTQSEVSNPEYSIAIDSSKGVARPRIVREVLSVKFNQSTSSNVQRTGRLITLPYTEVAFINQPFATKYRSAAHVAFAWNGKCILIPSYDNHSDINNTGSLNISIDNTTPWKEFAQSPLGSIWGDWRTTTNVVSTSVISGKQNVTDLTINVGWRSNHDPDQAVLQYMVANYGEASIHGLNVTAIHSGGQVNTYYFA